MAQCLSKKRELGPWIDRVFENAEARLFCFVFPKELDSSNPVLTKLSIVSLLWERRILMPEAIVEALSWLVKKR